MNSKLEITARELDDAGLGVGVAEGLPGEVELHVADLLPGERAVVAIDHRSPHAPRAWGRVVERLGAPAAERVAPACPNFGQCGGCAWQHLAHDTQLEHKRERVRRALTGAGIDVEVAAVAPAERTLGYRNIGKYVAAVGAGGELVLGGYAPRSHRVIDMAGCRVVEPVIDQVREVARRALAGLRVYDERSRTGQLRYVVIRTGAPAVAGAPSPSGSSGRSGVDARALVALVTTGDTPRPAVVDAARTIVADSRVSGVVWVRNDARTGAILTNNIEPLRGRPTITETVAGPVAIDIELGIGDFFQIHREQAARLYARVAELAAGATRALDFYCGVGGIAFALAGANPDLEVLGIERNAGAVAAANRAAERAGLQARVRFRAGVAADAQALGAGSGAPAGMDLVVVNPPRKGLDSGTLAVLSQIAPARIIYVSCGPESLARDLSILCGSGEYRVERVEPYDLMPGTAQVETIAVLVSAD